MAIDDDLPEYIGADKSQLAAPKSKPAPHPDSYSGRTAPAAADGLADDEPAAHVEPAPRVAVYNPPEPGSSHPRHAVLSPALRVDEAEAALNRATLELTNATRHLRACELAEADAEGALMAELPGPTQDEALRAYAANQLKQRADRVAAGLSPEPVVVSKVNGSPIDRQAASRMRTAPGLVSNPLRSATPRRAAS